MIETRYGKYDDLAALTDIYNEAIINSHATFLTQPVRPAERIAWLDGFRDKGPYRLLLATEAGKVLGYTCSFAYRGLPAFSETIETSVYVASSAKGNGVGKLLYDSLFDLLKSEKIHRALVGIALPNEASVRLHQKCGFTEVGVFDEYAKVNGVYYSSLWMQKKLEEKETTRAHS
jgi:phosphinothricin acetyltransferase